jgi:ubiquinone/menaquinone biosynthesis C-methylase UbiE
MKDRQSTINNERLDREQEFHDRRFADDSERQQKVSKFYQITNSIQQTRERLLLSNCKNAKVIEYGCGKGSYAFELAQKGAKLVTGIDISPVAIELAKTEAKNKGIENNLEFKVMNAENLEFKPNSYDLICGSGILHYLELDKALNSIVKVLQPNGTAIFLEPLGHNFLINLYRQFTPSIRSADEHPLLKSDLDEIGNYFQTVNIRYFYLTSLAASFLAGKPGFSILLNCLEFLDSLLLKLPPLKKQAWLVLLELSKPIK